MLQQFKYVSKRGMFGLLLRWPQDVDSLINMITTNFTFSDSNQINSNLL